MHKYCLFFVAAGVVALAFPRSVSDASEKADFRPSAEAPGSAFVELLEHIRLRVQSENNQHLVGGSPVSFVGAMAPADSLGAALLQSAIDEAFIVLMRSDLGRSICRDILKADSDLLTRYLGVSRPVGMSLAADCASWTGPRHPFVSEKRREDGSGDVADQKLFRAYSVWGSSGPGTNVRSVSHLDGWFTHLIVNVPLVEWDRAELLKLSNEFHYNLAYQVFGVFFDDEDAWFANAREANLGMLAARLGSGPLVSVVLSSMRASHVAHSLVHRENPKAYGAEQCLWTLQLRTEALFPYLALGIAFDRSLSRFLIGTFSQLPLYERVLVELTLKSIEQELTDNLPNLERLTHVLGVNVVPSVLEIFTKDSQVRRDFEEVREILMDRILGFKEFTFELAHLPSSAVVCAVASRPQLSLPTTPRRMVPALELWSEKNR